MQFSILPFWQERKKAILRIALVLTLLYFLCVLIAAHTIYHDRQNRFSHAMENLFPYPAAVVDHQVITLKRFRLEVSAREIWGEKHSLTVSQQETEKEVTQQLVDRTLYITALKAHNITISDADVQQRLSQIYQQSGGEAKFQVFLSQNYGQQVNIAQFTQWTRELLAEAGVQYQLLTQATVSHILFAVPANATPDQIEAIRQKALSVRSQITDVSKFGDFAKQYSEDQASRDKGGSLGTTGRSSDQPVYSADFENAIFTLPVGQISQPVRSPYGWHLILVQKREGNIDESLSQYTNELRHTYQVRSWLGN